MERKIFSLWSTNMRGYAKFGLNAKLELKLVLLFF